MFKGCVNIKSPEFLSLARTLNISEGLLRNIVADFWGKNEDMKFPTAQEVISMLLGVNEVTSQELITLWLEQFSKPQSFKTFEGASSYFLEASLYFNPKGIMLKETLDGKYEVSVAEPTLKKSKDITDAISEKVVKGLSRFGIDISENLINSLVEKYKGSTKPTALLFNQILNILKESKAKITFFKDNNYADIMSVLGNQNEIQIFINPSRLYSSLIETNLEDESIQDKFLRIVTHELVHSVTSAVVSPSTSVGLILGHREAETAFNKEIAEAYNIALRKLGNLKFYGLTNRAEFLSEALTNPSFQKALAEIKIDNNISIWQKVLNSIATYFKKAFGIDIKNTLLEKVLDASDTYFNYIAEHEMFKDDITPMYSRYNAFEPNISYTLSYEEYKQLLIEKVTNEYKQVYGDVDYVKRLLATEIKNTIVSLYEKSFAEYTQASSEYIKVLEDLETKYSGIRKVLEEYITVYKDRNSGYYKITGVRGKNIKAAPIELFINYLEDDSSIKNNIIDSLGGEEGILYLYNKYIGYAYNETTNIETEYLPTPEHIQRYEAESKRINDLINTLLDSDAIDLTEIRDLAELTVYAISDILTELLENPELILQVISSPLEGQERLNYIDSLKEKDRKEIVRLITPSRFISYCKDKIFREKFDIKTMAIRRTARILVSNFEALLKMANTTMIELEGFSFTIENGESDISNANIEDIEAFDTNEESTDIYEELGNQLEGWQLDNATKQVYSSLSLLVKSELLKMYQLNPDGTVVKSDKWGIAQRVNPKDATASILRWCQGTFSLTDMIEVLKTKQLKNPWVSQLITKLSDKTGLFTEFLSQFYGAFQKHFQIYSVTTVERDHTGTHYEVMPVNVNPALKEAMKIISTAYKIGLSPMFTLEGRILSDANHLGLLKSINEDLGREALKADNQNWDLAANAIARICNAFAYNITPEFVKEAISGHPELLKSMYTAMKIITDTFTTQANNPNYKPFDIKDKNGIVGNMKTFIKPLTDVLEDTAISSFYDNGKMYQSYITPSYMTKLILKFQQTDLTKFNEFLEKEYGYTEWFKQGNNWVNGWLNILSKTPVAERKKLMQHKTALSFDKHNYMRNLDDAEYTLSILTEFFTSGKASASKVLTWYRMPILSNKPSSEFISFYKYVGDSMKETLTEQYIKIALLEISRILTVRLRNLEKSDPRYIKNFDSNGKKFCYLTFLNAYLNGSKKDTTLGKMLESKLNNDLTDNTTFIEELGKVITESIDAKVNQIYNQWKLNGVLEGMKGINYINKTEQGIRNAVEEFVWNDTYAAMLIMQLTIVDPAFYKDAEDLLKRLALLHAPGIRSNIEAVDFNGQRVSDGIYRTFILKDFDSFKSNIIENLTEVFDRKIDMADMAHKESYKAMKEAIILAFMEINVADAQGYSSPSSYRKKAFMLGKWSRQAENIYQKLKNGTYTYDDLKVAFQPLKPFVYSLISMLVGVSGTPISNIKMGVQYKNSEYLLILADAILQGEETGRPNLLRAIYEVMENSADNDFKTCIDTVLFESTTKAGLSGRIDLNQFLNQKGGENAAIAYLNSLIYTGDRYNTDYVREVPYEDYAELQVVPEHFNEHELAHGSLIRMIIPSDLTEKNADGSEVYYEFMDKGVLKKLTAKEFRQEYEDNIAENINRSIEELKSELLLDSDDNGYKYSEKDRNKAISRILQREILSNARYGIDLFQACSVDENGKFRIPLGDPIQSKRIELLINSIIKNRINKLEIAGGPVVQVSNYGTARQLNIIFKDKTGGILKTREEFAREMYNGEPLTLELITNAYKEYIKEHLGGIAYYECYAPIYTNELFENFADKDGNIDIAIIEKVNPELLLMIGYRIPTEDKYSTFPCKIVGFMPREAGDGIMLPADITTITGSDFDVDKMYLMRKKFYMKSSLSSIKIKGHSYSGESLVETLSAYEEYYLLKDRERIGNVLRKSDFYTPSQEEVTQIQDEVKKDIEFERQGIEKTYLLRKELIENMSSMAEDINFDEETKAIDEGQSEERAIKNSDYWQDKIDKLKERRLNRLELWRETLNIKLDNKIDASFSKALDKFINQRKEELIQLFIDMKMSKIKIPQNDAIMSRLESIYLQYLFKVTAPTEGKYYNDNKIIDMTWAVLTHETQAANILNPGGFEPQKRTGYMVAAYRLGYDWDKLEKMSLSDLKKACSVDKNLAFIDTLILFYKQNSAASTILGMFAVQKIAHATLEGNGLHIDVTTAAGLEKEGFTLMDKVFDGQMPLDIRYTDDGVEYIGKVLGSLVASAADAVKDPVLNLMNINSTTAGVLTTLIRLGMPWHKAALFISSNAISKVLDKFNTERIKGNYTSLNSIIEDRIKLIQKELNIDNTSKLNTDELTEEECIKGLRDGDIAIEYKTLKMYQYLSSIASAVKSPSYCTRFNSISNAVGPLIIDNLIMQYKLDTFSECVRDNEGTQINAYDIFDNHPILEGFAETLSIAESLFTSFPVARGDFRRVLLKGIDSICIGDSKSFRDKIYGDRRLLNKLVDFYTSYLLVSSDVINTKDLYNIITQLPLKLKDWKVKYSDNYLILMLRNDVDKKTNLPLLILNTTGMEENQKAKLRSAWADLYKKEETRDIALDLFRYNFFRGGIGFSPKTFMSLLPNYMRERITGYTDAFTKTQYTNPYNVIDLFIRNNVNDNKLVPRLIDKWTVNDDGSITISGNKVNDYMDKPYIKTVSKDNVTLYKAVKVSQVNGKILNITYSPISILGFNGLYLEMSKDDIIQSEYQTTTLTQEESELNEELDEILNDKEITSSAIDNLHRVYQAYSESEGRTLTYELAKLYASKRNAAEKQRVAPNVKNFFRKWLTKLNIPFNEEMIDNMYDEMNAC